MANRRYTKPAPSPPPFTDWLEVPVMFEIPVAARLLGMTPEVVRRKVVEGELPGLRLHGTWRFRKDKLMAHLGYLPWEIDHYGYGMPVDREQRRQDEREAGLRIQKEIEEGRAS